MYEFCGHQENVKFSSPQSTRVLCNAMIKLIGVVDLVQGLVMPELNMPRASLEEYLLYKRLTRGKEKRKEESMRFLRKRKEIGSD